MGQKLIDITGQIFDRLTVTRYVGGGLWECKCTCGNIRLATGSKLRNGHTQSCGCLKTDIPPDRPRGGRPVTHGESRRGQRTKEYEAWAQMLDRCKSHPRYAGRGIEVCERWQTYQYFLEDMGRAPTPQHSIDRIDNNGNYKPGNCRWATDKEQSNNRRTNRRLTWNGTTRTVAEWADEVGMNADTLKHRIRKGWPIERALTEPVGHT